MPLMTHFECSIKRLTVVSWLVVCWSMNVSAESQFFKTGEQRHGADVYQLGEPARAGAIVLDANNGFFDRGVFIADGRRPAPSDSEKALIHAHFTHLVAAEKESLGTAHWYLWIPKAGDVDLVAHWKVPPSDHGVQWEVRLDNDVRKVVAGTSSETTPQKWDLKFSVKQPGRHTISIRKLTDRIAKGTEIHGIRLTGRAIVDASLLRARWRPAAIHTQYSASTCPQTKMWVFESQNISDYGSYSPITTPFGYFGGSFDADRTANGGMNFSMWAARSGAKSAPPLHQMPHLLATGNPQAEFGGFGHEGSGVKIRNWEPLNHHPRSIIQALRMDIDENSRLYSGYVFDDRDNRWVLYAVGRKPNKVTGDRKTGPQDPDWLRMSSFCEIPGPAERERTGDRPRVIRRRGWAYNADRQWHPVDHQTTRSPGTPSNRYIAAAEDGWFVMSTGGMDMFDQKTIEVKQPAPGGLPPYLQSDIAAKLFEYPAEFGKHSAEHIAQTSAQVNYELLDVGENATAVLYYGPQDCLSFVPRDDFHATERKGVIDKVYSMDRVWPAWTKSTPVDKGVSNFTLINLKPDTEYFYRLFVTNNAGKIWSFDAGKFQTKRE
jgi:hypothetical protein